MPPGNTIAFSGAWNATVTGPLNLVSLVDDALGTAIAREKGVDEPNLGSRSFTVDRTKTTETRFAGPIGSVLTVNAHVFFQHFAWTADT